MLQFPHEIRDEMIATVGTLARQLAAHVSLYRHETGTMLVPLHPLLDTVELDPLVEMTALTLFHPKSYTLGKGETALMVPVGEALAVLPFSRHFPDAIALVAWITTLQTALEKLPTPSPDA